MQDLSLRVPENRSIRWRYVLDFTEDWVKNQQPWPANIQREKKKEEAKKRVQATARERVEEESRRRWYVDQNLRLYIVLIGAVKRIGLFSANTSNLVGVDFVGPHMGGFNDPNLGKYTILVFVNEECMHMAELVIGGGWHHMNRTFPTRSFELWDHH